MLKWGSNGFHFHSMFTCLHSSKQSLILYSKSVLASKDAITNPLMIEFLVKLVGFSEEEAVSVVNKVRYPLTSVKRSELVVDFLKESGFDGRQIRNVVAKLPNVLRNNVEKTLKPKIRVFEDLGFSGSNLGTIISRYPHVLDKSVDHYIVPILEMLKSIFGSNDQLVRVILQIRSQRLFSSQVWKNVPANVQFLKSYGLASDKIKWLILNSSLLFSNTQRVEKLVKGTEEKLGIPLSSDMFIYGIHALSLKSEEKMESWLEVFRHYGWSETDISKLLKRNPSLLGLSEERVRSKLKYFMEDLGLGSDYVATHATLLGFSMEKRVLPRVAVRQALLDNNLLKREIGIYSCLLMTESKFKGKFVIPYKETLPQLYEDYTKSTGSSVSKTQSAQVYTHIHHECDRVCQCGEEILHVFEVDVRDTKMMQLMETEDIGKDDPMWRRDLR